MLRFAILKEIRPDAAVHLGILRKELQGLPDGEFKQRIMKILNIEISQHTVVCELEEQVVIEIFRNLLCGRIPGDREHISAAINDAWKDVATLLKREVARHPERI